MSGHSKWATIKRKKGSLDVQRSKAFTRVAREISVAVTQGGPDINSNPRLKLAVQNAKGVNMPKDRIERAINGAISDKSTYNTIIYEGNGIKGSSYMIECLTDNPNRSVGDVRSVFSKHNCTLGKTGSVSYNFDKKSFFIVDVEGKIDVTNNSEIDNFFLELVDYDVDDISVDENNCLLIIGSDSSFGVLQSIFDSKKMTIKEGRLAYFPKSTISLSEEDLAKVTAFIDSLEEISDVQYVYTNVCFD